MPARPPQPEGQNKFALDRSPIVQAKAVVPAKTASRDSDRVLSGPGEGVSAPQDLQHRLELGPDLADDLLALAEVALGLLA